MVIIARTKPPIIEPNSSAGLMALLAAWLHDQPAAADRMASSRAVLPTVPVTVIVLLRLADKSKWASASFANAGLPDRYERLKVILPKRRHRNAPAARLPAPSSRGTRGTFSLLLWSNAAQL